ncbi:MAG: hypothetical protein ABL907_18605 [Hyphomicrobium sp.]
MVGFAQAELEAGCVFDEVDGFVSVIDFEHPQATGQRLARL